MREILFKAKREDNGEWVEGNLVYSINDSEVIIIPVNNGDMYMNDYNDIGFGCWCKVQADTLCQYTGLTDKNGVKIWENDIVKDSILRYPLQIIYSEENGGWAAKRRHTYVEYGVGTINQSCYTVIGNIFDNPELLEKQVV